MIFKKTNDGFTMVEVIVTLIVAAIFIGAIFELYVTQSKMATVVSTFYVADQLAYNNLRTFAFGQPPTWFTCTKSGTTIQPVTLKNDNSAVAGLPGPVLQTVIATAPFGCGGGSTGIGYPIQVQSIVKYGNGRVVSHATYSSF